MIIENQIFTQANEIKTKRRNTADRIVNADTKPLVYAVQCGSCCRPLKHTTQRKLKNSEKWYCENLQCCIVSRITISELKSEIIEILNLVILNPELVEQDEFEQEMSPEIRLM